MKTNQILKMSLLCLGLFLGTLIFSSNTLAAVINVTTSEDSLTADGKCSLREAIRNANLDKQFDNKDCKAGSGDDYITVPAGTYLFALSGIGEDSSATGDLDINSNVEIHGEHGGATIIDGNGLDQVFDIDTSRSGNVVKLCHLTISGGNGYIGGITNYGNLTLTNSTVSGNISDTVGGIYNYGQLTLKNTTVSDNTGELTGGIYNTFGQLTLQNSTVSGNTGELTGGISNFDTLTLENSIVSGNISPYIGGIDNSSGTLTLTNSTVSDNSGDFLAGGIVNHATLILTNSTVSGNISSGTGTNVGGIWNYIGGTLTLVNSTVSNNIGDYGGILSSYSIATIIKNSTIAFNTGTSTGGFSSGNPGVTIENSVIANNTGGYYHDCVGTIDTINYSLVQDATACTFTSSTGLLTGVDPLLVPSLDLNGGTTHTHKLKSTSPAIDAGNPAGCTDADGVLLITDQRGKPRPFDGDGDGNAICDIGAYERQR